MSLRVLQSKLSESGQGAQAFMLAFARGGRVRSLAGASEFSIAMIAVEAGGMLRFRSEEDFGEAVV